MTQNNQNLEGRTEELESSLIQRLEEYDSTTGSLPLLEFYKIETQPSDYNGFFNQEYR